ncbi:hypothetical protein SCP_0902130 [Sparassis crispa]|uniref:Uncharacterized protein n=1 Tax=Sparassis crispa TaxID=139825 RepID=A0A401GX39_9APHY|nr:hypothetical protein SCP_0902130 [Sparassis crispa]GBE86334.1 hypothetical protein SCP_0902130 [Sparassis crispa]
MIEHETLLQAVQESTSHLRNLLQQKQDRALPGNFVEVSCIEFMHAFVPRRQRGQQSRNSEVPSLECPETPKITDVWKGNQLHPGYKFAVGTSTPEEEGEEEEEGEGDKVYDEDDQDELLERDVKRVSNAALYLDHEAPSDGQPWWERQVMPFKFMMECVDPPRILR